LGGGHDVSELLFAAFQRSLAHSAAKMKLSQLAAAVTHSPGGSPFAPPKTL
jgi:hypothetical protein